MIKAKDRDRVKSAEIKLRLKDKVQTFPDLYLQRKNTKFLVVEPKRLKWAVIGEGFIEYLEFFAGEKSIKSAKNAGMDMAKITELYEAGWLIVNGQTIGTPVCSQKNTNNKLSLVVIETSNACNFRCTYCYSNATNGALMDLKIAKRAIDDAAEIHDQPVTILFHGGEPLLNFDLIKSTVDYANRFVRKDGSKKFFFSIQTNLSLINLEKLEFLKKHAFDIGISIDGPKDFNDQTRKFKNGKGTYNSIVKGIKLLQRNKMSFGTILVVSDINVIDHIYDFMVEHGIDHIKINPYFMQGRAQKKMPVQTLQKKYAYKTLRLVDRLIENNTTDKKLIVDNASVMLKIILGQDNGSMCMGLPCGAGVHTLGIGFDGAVYPCDSMKGVKGLSIGNIQFQSMKKMLNAPLVNEIKKRTADFMEDCRLCWLRSGCKVNCANNSYNRAKTFLEKSEMCGYYKIMFPELMWRVYQFREQIHTLIE